MKTKLKPNLKFNTDIFNVRIKVYIGDVEDIAQKIGVNIFPPFAAFEWTDGETIHIGLPEDYSEELLNHETTHATFDLFAILGAPINESTEEFFAYIDTYIKAYIKENL